MITLDFFTVFYLLQDVITASNQKISDNGLYRKVICLGQNNRDQENNPNRHIIGKVQISQSANSSVVYKQSESFMAERYEALIFDGLSADAQKRFVRSIQRILEESVAMPKDERIGDHFTKEDILTHREFCLPQLLAGLVKYVVPRANKHLNSFKEDKEDLRRLFESVEIGSMELVSLRTVLPPERNTAKLDVPGFKETFREVTAMKLPDDFKNPNQVKVYALNMQNSSFRYDRLMDFLYTNVEHYVMSTLKEKEYADEDKIKLITHEAIEKFRLLSGKEDIKKTYSKIMLYVFMELGLGAPKLFNAIEIKDRLGRTIRSDGIYYLKAGIVDSSPLLVLGASDASGSLDTAIENAMLQARMIADDPDEVASFVNKDILKESFATEDLNYIIRRLIDGEGILESDHAIGVFISYSVGLVYDGSMSNSEYSDLVRRKMEKDAAEAIPHIYSLIRNHGLANYYFYFFILPIGDVDTDVPKIMSKIAGGGEDG